MVPQKKINRHEFNLIIARAKVESDIDNTAFKIGKTQENISDLQSKRLEMEEKKQRLLEKVKAVEESIAAIDKKISEKESDIATMQKKIDDSGITPILNVTLSPVTPSHFEMVEKKVI